MLLSVCGLRGGPRVRGASVVTRGTRRAASRCSAWCTGRRLKRCVCWSQRRACTASRPGSQTRSRMPSANVALKSTPSPPNEPMVSSGTTLSYSAARSTLATGWIRLANWCAGTRRTLSPRPVSLFCSGPVGDPGRKLVQTMAVDPVELPEIRKSTHAPDHRLFAGKLDRKNLTHPHVDLLRGARRLRNRRRGHRPVGR